MVNCKLKIIVCLIFIAGAFEAQAGVILKAPPYIGLQEGLVGFWSFDGPDMIQGTNNVWAMDRSGQGNNGKLKNTATSSVRVAGKIGQALEFDGSDDYVDTNDIQAINPGNSQPITLSAWIYPRSTSGAFPSILTKWNSGSGFTFFLTNNGTQVGWQVQDVGNGRATTNANTIIRDAWNHVVGVYTGTQLLVYIDGIVSATAATTATNEDSGRSFKIGIPDDGSGLDYFNGLIDEVRIYNRALTADEIKRLYKIGSTFVVNKTRQDTLREGLVGHWSFDGPDISESGGNSFARDRSGNGNSGQLTNGPVRKAGKIGQALDFDGVDDYILESGPANNFTDFTFSTWLKTSSPAQAAGIIFGDKFANFSSGNKVGLAGGNFFARAGGTACTSVAVPTDNSWHLYTVIRDSSNNWTIYLDGSGTNCGTGPGSATYDFNSIAANTQPDQFYLGLLDEVRIYNRALSADEIKRLYKIGSTFVVNKTRQDTLREGLVGHWSFDGPDMIQGTNNVWAMDRSGQGNNGKLKNTATSSVRVAGKIGQALEFDGVDDYVSTNLGTIVTQYEYTWSAWIHPNQITASGLVAFGSSAGGNFIDGLTINGSGKIILYQDGSVLTSNATVNTGSWYHIVGTMSDSANAAKIYINGSLDVSGVDAGWDAEGCTLFIGAQDSGSGCSSSLAEFNGLIDDVRIYNRALSADEIKRLYNMGR